jgi:thermostable 8-oxoguanine DNA glycosylase
MKLTHKIYTNQQNEICELYDYAKARLQNNQADKIIKSDERYTLHHIVTKLEALIIPF